VVLEATSIILAHNHPSGDPSPSAQDVGVTEELIKAGKLLDIEVLDHVVIGANDFVSLQRQGLAFRPNGRR
jgi:DNA repair protein RadC